MTEEEITKQLTAFVEEWSGEERTARLFSQVEVEPDSSYLLGRADALKEILNIFEVWSRK